VGVELIAREVEVSRDKNDEGGAHGSACPRRLGRIV
jgi:hypothetical protein